MILFKIYLFVSFLYFNVKSTGLDDFPVDLWPNFYGDVVERINKFTRNDGITSKPLLPTSIRLVFHDCAGKDLCNGCINPNNPEHNGLEYGAIYAIEQVYQNSQTITVKDLDNETITYTTNDGWTGNPSGRTWSNLIWDEKFWNISRADIWANFGTAAFEYGVVLAGIHNTSLVSKMSDVCLDPEGNATPKLSDTQEGCIDMAHVFGRTDCATSPFVNAVDDEFEINTQWGWNDIFNFFHNKFAMNEVHVVALMGIHTLGEGHAYMARNETNETHCCGGDGFRGAWVGNNNGDVLVNMDNEYFKMLRDFPWVQRKSNERVSLTDNEYSKFGDKIQWMTPKPANINATELDNLMLNVDMCILMNFETQNYSYCDNPMAQTLFNDSMGDGIILNRTRDFKNIKCERNLFHDVETKLDSFIQDNTMWLYDFVNAWELMTFKWGNLL